MRVLLTNQSLQVRGGSELYVRDVARAIAARGMQPIVYAPRLGEVADDLRAAAIPVADRLERIAEPPDLIHGQHNLPTVAALLHFPQTPALFVCHGWLPWEERPPRFRRILRYVAVDRLRRERLVSEEGISPDRVHVIPNFVDVDRFAPREQPLPARPRRALVFSNQARPDEGYAALVQQAAAAEGVEVDMLGHGTGHSAARPERHLGEYDLVFARGRCALEALATGAAVALCDAEGLGPLVTGERVEALAAFNFGIGALRESHRVDALRQRIRDYDPAAAAEASRWVRANATLGGAVERLVELYHEVRAEWDARDPGEEAEERREAALYLEDLQATIGRYEVLLVEEHVGTVAATARAAEAASRAREAGAAAERLRSELAQLAHRSDARERERLALASELELLRGTAAVRLRDWLLRHAWLSRLYRAAARAPRAPTP